MFEPKTLHVAYRIETPGGRKVEFSIRLNARGLVDELPASGPLWTRRGRHGCPDCSAGGEYCLAALAIAPVVEQFHDLGSLQEVHACAEHAGRSSETRCPAPLALASVMGLLIAASGCPKSLPFRAMALYHLPFATAEETLTRAAGFWLLNLWAERALAVADPFARLIEAWGRLEEINIQLGRRLHESCPNDAAPNGVAYLDALAKIGMMAVESRLEALKPAFLSYGLDAGGTPAASTSDIPARPS